MIKAARAYKTEISTQRFLERPKKSQCATRIQVGQSLKPGDYCHVTGRLEKAAEKGPHSFCHSERSEESLFLFSGSNRREIPRFARNDKINLFFRNLFSRDLQGCKSRALALK